MRYMEKHLIEGRERETQSKHPMREFTRGSREACEEKLRIVHVFMQIVLTIVNGVSTSFHFAKNFFHLYTHH